MGDNDSFEQELDKYFEGFSIIQNKVEDELKKVESE